MLKSPGDLDQLLSASQPSTSSASAAEGGYSDGFSEWLPGQPLEPGTKRAAGAAASEATEVGASSPLSTGWRSGSSAAERLLSVNRKAAASPLSANFYYVSRGRRWALSDAGAVRRPEGAVGGSGERQLHASTTATFRRRHKTTDDNDETSGKSEDDRTAVDEDEAIHGRYNGYSINNNLNRIDSIVAAMNEARWMLSQGDDIRTHQRDRFGQLKTKRQPPPGFHAIRGKRRRLQGNTDRLNE
jgi:hypothetical protein